MFVLNWVTCNFLAVMKKLRSVRVTLMGLLWCSLLWSLPLQAQPRLVAQVESQRVAPGEMLQVQFTVEQTTKVTRFNPPDFTGFRVIQGPAYTSGWTLVNGEMKEYVAISFLLQPLRTGKLTIGPAAAVVDGKTLKSAPLSVEVSGNAGSVSPYPSPQSPGDQPLNDMILRKGETVRSKINNNLFVRLEVSKRTVFVGEPVVATYKLYTRLNSESKVVRRPSFSGFSVFDMMEPESSQEQTERLNGKDYNVYLLRMAQLYPLQPGSYTLESMQVDNIVRFIRGEAAGDQNTINGILRNLGQDQLDPSAWVKETVSVENAPLVITVKPLPAAGQPDSFSGAVGKFTLRAEAPRDSLVVGQSYTYQVFLEGKGNMPMIAAPAMQWSDAWDPFEPETKLQIDQGYSPFTGAKIYSVPFTPRKAGRQFLPAASLSYFDPSVQQYVRLKTDSIAVQVQTQSAAALSAGSALRDAASDSGKGEGLGGSRSWWPWLLVPVVMVPLLWLLFRRRRTPSAPATPRPLESLSEELPEPVTQLHLFPVRQNLDQARSFMVDGDAPRCYQEMIRVFRTVLAERYQVDALAARPRLVSSLAAVFPGSDLPESIASIMEHCQQAVYAPLADPQVLEADLQQASRLLDILQPPPPGPVSPSSAAG